MESANSHDSNDLTADSFSTRDFQCVDCRNPITRTRAIRAKSRCDDCEWRFLTVLDPKRLAVAKASLELYQQEIELRGQPPIEHKLDRSTTRYVYFARRGPIVKIGIATNPHERMRALETGAGAPVQLLGAIVGTAELEKSVHQQFRAHRVHGEWFNAVPAILEYIRIRATHFRRPADA